MVTDTLNKKIPAGYKQTKVGVIPSDWEVKNLGECLTRPPNYGINAPAVDYTDNLPRYIRITDITEDGRYSFEKPVSVKHTQANKYYLSDGDVVLARTGASVGKSYRYRPKDGKLVFAGFLIRVTPDQSILLSAYLAAFLQTKSYWNWVNLNSMRSGQPGINGNEYAQLPVPIPSIKEQTAIACVFSDADALIEGLEKLIAKKRAIKQGAMQELLTGKRRLPGFTKKWEVKKLEEIADIDPENLGGNTNPNYAFKYISLEDVDAGTLRGYSEQVFSTAPSRARRKVRQGDVLVSTVRPNLQSHLFIRDDVKDTVCSTGFSVVRCKPSIADPAFVYYHLFTNGIERQIEAVLSGSNYPAINRRDVKALAIPFPSHTEQVAVASVILDMDTEINALERKRAKYKALKQGMMQVLLTGKIRLPH